MGANLRYIKLYNGLLAGGIAVGVGAYASAHSLLLYKYREHMAMYSQGTEKQLDPDMKRLTTECLKEMKIARRHKPFFEFFHVFGIDVFHAGSTGLKCGSLIGIPFNFNYKSVDEIDPSKITVLDNQPVKWMSMSGKELLESLILSEAAQKFAILREMYATDNSQVSLNCYTGIASIMLSYAFILMADKTQNLMSKPAKTRIIIMGLCFLVGATNFILVKDGLSWYYNKDSDLRAVRTNEAVYYDGALEFYNKILARNRSLRNMMGPSGEKYFTAEGDPKPFLRMTTIPPSQRLKLIIDYKNNDI